MARYRKVEPRVWRDEKFQRLTRSSPSGQVLWLYLLTCPHSTAIPGLYVAGPGSMCDDLGWELEAFREAFRELLAEGMVKYDSKHRLVYIQNAISHNSPESPNVVTGWARHHEELPNCPLRDEAYSKIYEYLEGKGKAYAKAFTEAFPKTTPKAMPNQEQEQEQEQEQDNIKIVQRPPELALSAERCELDFDLEPPEWVTEQVPLGEYPEFESIDEPDYSHQPLQAALTEEEHLAIESLSSGEQQPNVAPKTNDLPLPLNELHLTATSVLPATKTSPRSNADVLAVWGVYYAHHDKAKRTNATDAIIRSRLKEGFTVEELKQAIEAAHHDTWHTAEPGRLALSYVLRNSDKVTRFLEMAAAPQQDDMAKFHAQLDKLKQEAIEAREGK